MDIELIEKNSKFWGVPSEDVIKAFNSNLETGLSQEEVQKRLDLFGKNIFHSNGKEISGFKIFLEQLKSPLILILIIAGIVTTFISHYRDSIFIFVAVVVNSVLGFYQENKAEKALAQLKTYLKQRARVIRGGKEKEVLAEDIVVGDIIRLSQGDRVSADARIIYANDFQVDEAILTGESLPVVKDAEKVKENSVLGDQTSMVFAGTLVIQGICTAVVCRTDKKTELGKIASLIEASSNEKTPLQKSITDFSIFLSVILSILTLFVFIIGIIVGKPFLEMFLTSVAIAVSAIPEGLPISITVILAVGVERMAKRKAVVRKLIAAEALGSTTVILTDKTGTLTMAKMVLSKIIPVDLSEDEMLKYALGNSNVLIENPEETPDLWRVNGKIMETAIVRSSALRGISYEKIMDKSHVLQTLPFNAIKKFSISLVRQSNKHFLVFFGAPDVLLSHSTLGKTEKEEEMNKINLLASSGERVLGLATKEIENVENFSLSKEQSFTGLSFRGVITFNDPLRPGIRSVIDRVKLAGVKTVILTGDHQGTAIAIANEIGLPTDKDSILDATEMAGMSEEDLKARLPQLAVVSRVTPFDKMRIAKLFQDSGEIVAMTGDGVNDAPSLKQANVGIAMGSGTEVAQSVADLVLLDDNFETIVAAIEEGRQILSNIKKVLVYLLSNVTDGLILIGGSLIVGLPLPLNALQILWVNFFTDSFPAISFAFEKDPDALFYFKQQKKIELFDPLMKFLVIVIGLSTSALLFVLYYFLLRNNYDEKLVQTFTFAAFGTYTLLVALSVRSLHKNIFSYSIFSNMYLTVGIIFGLILMSLAIYHPFFQGFFETVSLPFSWAMGVLLIGVINIVLIEIAKWFFRKSTSTNASSALS